MSDGSVIAATIPIILNVIKTSASVKAYFLIIPPCSMYRNDILNYSIKLLYMQHANSKKSAIIFQLLAQELKKERESQNKSLRLLAYEFDIQMSLLSRLENGVNEPKLISIWTVCEALGIKPSELMKRIEDKLPNDYSLIDS